MLQNIWSVRSTDASPGLPRQSKLALASPPPFYLRVPPPFSVLYLTCRMCTACRRPPCTLLARWYHSRGGKDAFNTSPMQGPKRLRQCSWHELLGRVIVRNSGLAIPTQTIHPTFPVLPLLLGMMACGTTPLSSYKGLPLHNQCCCGSCSIAPSKLISSWR